MDALVIDSIWLYRYSIHFDMRRDFLLIDLWWAVFWFKFGFFSSFLFLAFLPLLPLTCDFWSVCLGKQEISFRGACIYSYRLRAGATIARYVWVFPNSRAKRTTVKFSRNCFLFFLEKIRNCQNTIVWVNQANWTQPSQVKSSQAQSNLSVKEELHLS